MKVVLVGLDLDAATSLPGHEVERVGRLWRQTTSRPLGFELPTIGVVPVNWIDCDLFIVNLAAFDPLDMTQARAISRPISDRVAAGGVLLIFGDANRGGPSLIGDRVETAYSWLQGILKVKAIKSGSGGEVVLGKDEALNRFIGPFLSRIRWYYELRFESWHKAGEPLITPVLLNKAKQVVGIHAKVREGHVFLLPSLVDGEGTLIATFVNNYLSTLSVNFDIAPAGATKPEWLSRWSSVTPAEELRKIETTRENISQLQSRLVEVEAKVAEMQQYQEDLLWQTGEDRLRSAVRWALDLLGLRCEPVDPIDLVGEWGGQRLLIEVTASKGPILVEKARQILERVVRAPSQTPVKGILIGNPFRFEPPDRRPPDKGQPLFVKEAQDIARDQGISLVLTYDLCRQVQAILRGDATSGDAVAVLERIIKNRGLVRL